PMRCQYTSHLLSVGYVATGNSCTSQKNDWYANAPNTAPLTTATPPTTSRISKGRPLSIWKSGVDPEPRYAPLSAPANPAIAAEIANPATLVQNRFTPSVAQAAGLSRMATSRRPNAPRRNATTPRPTMQNNAVTNSSIAASSLKWTPSSVNC